MRRNNSNLLHIDLARVYEAAGSVRDAEDEYTLAIEELPKSQGSVIRTANVFIQLNKPDYALRTYEKGKKLLEGTYPFNYEIASLYGSMGDTQRMISEYLNLIEYNEAYVQTVQNALNRSIGFTGSSENEDLLRTELLKKIQKSPEKTIFSEMLTWLFIQQKDFNSAFIQMKALDKRLAEDGARVMNLAELCISNQEYSTAVKCFNYVIEKGKSSVYYNSAREGVLDARFSEIKEEFKPDSLSLKALESEYISTLDELGKSASTLNLMRQLANLQAYYIQDKVAANNLLNDAISLPGLSEEARAECKLDLADLLITRNYIWDASLLYSQVDKDFKYDVLGFRAKFMNAKISYYTGEFSWAQAQLDVLKGSTSKLISNNAMDLSLLITDNLALDTIQEPMLIFARADLLLFQNQYDNALATLDTIIQEFPGHLLEDDILYKRAQIFYKKKDFDTTANLLKEILTSYPTAIVADNALYDLANLNRNELNNPEEAQELYKQLMLNYPGSLFVADARKKFRELRGDNPDEEPSPEEKFFRSITP